MFGCWLLRLAKETEFKPDCLRQSGPLPDIGVEVFANEHESNFHFDAGMTKNDEANTTRFDLISMLKSKGDTVYDVDSKFILGPETEFELSVAESVSEGDWKGTVALEDSGVTVGLQLYVEGNEELIMDFYAGEWNQEESALASFYGSYSYSYSYSYDYSEHPRPIVNFMWKHHTDDIFCSTFLDMH